ncbi:hypothetical protein GCM10009745_80150 [Kribbella yunnanensis]|uniref:AAA+ ATPase domain-containing protein n=1 Tax=Kribbella yunnanensis TaxID=190194 RepID=A0ABP4V9F1_9ACTN
MSEEKAGRLANPQAWSKALPEQLLHDLESWAAGQTFAVRLRKWQTEGASGSYVASVMLEPITGMITGAILKLLPRELAIAESQGAMLAQQQSPAGFSEVHLTRTRLVSPLPGTSGIWVHLQDVAQSGTGTMVSLKDLTKDQRFAEYCGIIITELMQSWNDGADDPSPLDMSPQAYLLQDLGPKVDGVRQFLADAGMNVDQPPAALVCPGGRGSLPNPLAVLNGPDAQGEVLVFRGKGHGDLNLGNVLLPQTDGTIRPDEFQLIDLGRYAADTPISRDPAKLLLSTAAAWLPSLRENSSIRSALAEAIVSPDSVRQSPEILGYIGVAHKIVQAAASWGMKRGLAEDWMRQHRLTLCAAALRTVARADFSDEDRWFYLEVAALALQEIMPAPIEIVSAAAFRTSTALVPESRSTASNAPPALEQSEDARARLLRMLLPQRLPELRRAFVDGNLMTALDRPGVVFIVANAGSGKSVTLGQLAAGLGGIGRPYVLVACSLAPEARTAKSDDDFSRLLGTLGAGLAGPLVPPPVPSDGAPVVLIDTADIVLSPSSARFFDRLLGALVGAGSPVVVTCRPQEYREYLEPFDQKLPSLALRPERVDVPVLTNEEIVELVVEYLRGLGVVPPGGAEAFAHSMTELATSRRPLIDIIRSPLLLGMVCELFGRTGALPPDLDVGRLYRRYWNVKISGGRADETDSLIAAKERLCRRMAEQMWSQSGAAIVDSADAMQVAESGADRQALRNLVSEGVIVPSPLDDKVLRFMHQTFAEFAMARYLGELAVWPILRSTLQEIVSRSHDLLHWWPVLRETFAIKVAQGSLGQVAALLPDDDLASFRALAFAAVRGDADLLGRLVAQTLEAAESPATRLRREALRETFGLVAPDVATAVAVLAVQLCERASLPELPASATAAAQVIATIPSEPDRVAQFGWALEVFSARRNPRDTRDTLVDDTIARFLEVFGAATGGYDELLCVELRRFLASWGGTAFRAAVLAHQSPNVPEPARRELGRIVKLGRSGAYPRDAEVAVIRLSRPWRRDDDTDDGQAMLEYLRAQDVDTKVRSLRASAVGALVPVSPGVLDSLVGVWARDDAAEAAVSLMALRSACQAGANVEVAQALAAEFAGGRLTPQAVSQGVSLVIDELASSLAGPARDDLREALGAEALRRPNDRILGALAAVSDDSIASWRTVLALLPRLPEDRRRRCLTNLLQIASDVIAVALLEELTYAVEHYAPGDGVALVRLLAMAAVYEPSARSQLIELMTDHRATVPKQVIAQLWETQAARTWLRPEHLRTLVLNSDLGLCIGGLELLRDVLTDPPPGGDLNADDLIRDALARHDPPEGSWVRSEETATHRALDLESRLLSCCNGWLRVAAPGDDGGRAGALLAERTSAISLQPPADVGLRRDALLLVKQMAWRQDQPVWQARARDYVDHILRKVSPAGEESRYVQDIFSRLTAARIASYMELSELAPNWTLGGRGELLRVVLDRDPLGRAGPAARKLLALDQNGYLTSIAADHR